jgi:hypothetical protein
MLLGMILSIIISGFIGLGNIFAGRVDDLLPIMKLELTLKGCPCTNGTYEAECRSFVDDESVWDLPSYAHWKDDHSTDTFWVKVWSTSYSMS